MDNIIQGWKGAKDKGQAVKCLFPYLQLYVLIYTSGYSRFYNEAALLFFLGLGLYQTYVAGLLNISSTAQIAFPWFYWEPIAYAVILVADATYLVSDSKVVIGLYAGLTLIVFVKYMLFMNSVVKQLTKYLGIRFLRVKDNTKKQ